MLCRRLACVGRGASTQSASRTISSMPPAQESSRASVAGSSCGGGRRTRAGQGEAAGAAAAAGQSVAAGQSIVAGCSGGVAAAEDVMRSQSARELEAQLRR
eukprot:3158111-Prymnesium_polylepis.1